MMRNAIAEVMEKVLAGQVMNTELLTIAAESTAREAAAFLTENQIGGAPVADRQGRLVGVVSLTDLAENEAERPEILGPRGGPGYDVREWRQPLDAAEIRSLHIESDDVLVRDIMTPTVYTVPDTTPVPVLARTMIAGRVHRLFITRGGRVVGIVTPLDLLELLAGDARPRASAARLPVAVASPDQDERPARAGGRR